MSQYSIDDLSLLITRETMYSREKWEIMFFAPLRYLFVREYHELFNQLVGVIAFSSFDIFWSFLYSTLYIIFEVKIYLRRLECDFPFFSSTLFENMI